MAVNFELQTRGEVAHRGELTGFQASEGSPAGDAAQDGPDTDLRGTDAGLGTAGHRRRQRGLGSQGTRSSVDTGIATGIVTSIVTSLVTSVGTGVGSPGGWGGGEGKAWLLRGSSYPPREWVLLSLQLRDSWYCDWHPATSF